MKKETNNPTALLETLPAAATPDWQDTKSIPHAKIPISREMPRELADHINRIVSWGKKNSEEARREKIYFWALKIPIIIATAGYGVMIKFDFEEGLAVSGAIASACALIDGWYKPGELRNFHHKASFDLSSLANDLLAKWEVGVLSGKHDPNKLAAELIEESRLRQTAISAHLSETEAMLGKDQQGAKQ